MNKSPKTRDLLMDVAYFALTSLTAASSIAIAQTNQHVAPVTLATTSQNTQTLAASALSNLQIPFVQNTGQTDAKVSFYAQTFAGTTYVTRQGELVYAIPGQNGKSGWTLVERFANGKAKPMGAQANTSKTTYIKKRPRQSGQPARRYVWQTGVRRGICRR